jgi:hypothetical protein
MQHQLAHSQAPNIIISKTTLGPLWILLEWLRNLLAIVGLLLIGTLGYLYFQGQQAARPFDDKFVVFLSKFVGEVLKKDVASAMVTKIKLEKGVTIKQAIQSMKLYANQLNIKFVQSYPLYKEIEAVTGNPSRFVEVFEFCDAAVAASLLEHNPDFSAHFPCRIALYEDRNGQLWLATLNLDLLIYGSQSLDSEVRLQSLKIQDGILKIMGAGASGAL